MNDFKNEILLEQLHDAIPRILEALNDGYDVMIKNSRNGIKLRQETSEAIFFKMRRKLKEGDRK